MATWKFDASLDGTNYTTILSSSTVITGTSTQTFNVNANGLAYKYFRIFAFTSTAGATNPGLSVFQVYYNTQGILKFLTVDGTNNMIANINMNSKLINNLTTPVSANVAANKTYVDTALATASINVRKKLT